MTDESLKPIIEAALFVADKPLAIEHLLELFAEPEQPERSAIRAILRELCEDYAGRGVELVQVASGYRFQTKENLMPWLKRLQGERSARYSRALLETVAIIAYRQPITRTEIESIRGISVSTDLIKKLLDYNWIRVLAHRDTPGRPALYGTTRAFLDYFNLKNLQDLPTLIELREIVDGQTTALDSEEDKDEKGKEHDAKIDNDAQVLESKDNEINQATNTEVADSEKDSDAQVFESKDNEINQTAPEVPKDEDKDTHHATKNELDSKENQIFGVPDDSEDKNINGTPEILESKANQINLAVLEESEPKDKNNNHAVEVLKSEDSQITPSTKAIESESEQKYSTVDMFDSKK